MVLARSRLRTRAAGSMRCGGGASAALEGDVGRMLLGGAQAFFEGEALGGEERGEGGVARSRARAERSPQCADGEVGGGGYPRQQPVAHREQQGTPPRPRRTGRGDAGAALDCERGQRSRRGRRRRWGRGGNSRALARGGRRGAADHTTALASSPAGLRAASSLNQISARDGIPKPMPRKLIRL